MLSVKCEIRTQIFHIVSSSSPDGIRAAHLHGLVGTLSVKKQ